MRDRTGLPLLQIATAAELSLTGNQTPQDVAAARMQWKVAGEEAQMPNVGLLAGAGPLASHRLPRFLYLTLSTPGPFVHAAEAGSLDARHDAV